MELQNTINIHLNAKRPNHQGERRLREQSAHERDEIVVSGAEAVDPSATRKGKRILAF